MSIEVTLKEGSKVGGACECGLCLQGREECGWGMGEDVRIACLQNLSKKDWPTRWVWQCGWGKCVH